eukprot:GHVT01085859.1.p1 GENE.GHVT01085859.1~~GHVT01085859.1.p1  ORF type:complete len:374 (+),score=29.61 GHVT01085859.1:2790-3911(+)
MGVLYGDAAGALCEGHRVPTAAEVVKSMNLSGGPPRKGIKEVRGPGQVTNDSEQTMAVADVLAVCEEDYVTPELFLDALLIWGKTGRVMGNQTSKALEIARKTDRKWCGIYREFANRDRSELKGMTRYQDHVDALFLSDKKDNFRKESNGALMRSIPLAVWGYDLTSDQLFELVKQAAKVSHSPHVVHMAEAYYVIVAANLIKTGDVNVALQEATDWWKKLQTKMKDRSEKAAYEKMRQWLMEAANLYKQNYMLSREYSANNFRKMGWVRWSFTLAIGHLHGRSKLENAVENAIVQGGDTNTNAAIVGGLLGAAQGLSAIPTSALNIVLSRGEHSEGITVPRHFYTEKALSKADAVLAAHARGEHYREYRRDD